MRRYIEEEVYTSVLRSYCRWHNGNISARRNCERFLDSRLSPSVLAGSIWHAQSCVLKLFLYLVVQVSTYCISLCFC